MRKRHIIIVVAMLTMLLPTRAQTDPDATIEALNYVIRSMPRTTDADMLVEDICKKFKNNPKVLVGIGESYYQASDSASAKKFFRRAIQTDPKYLASYIAAGDWARDRYGSGALDEACEWYDRAIKVNPKDSTAYIRYAKVLTMQRKPEEAANKIKEITAHDPNFPVNLQIARIYSDLGRLDEAIDFYGSEKMDNLPLSDLIEYATVCYLKNKNEEAAKAVAFGRQKFPRSAQIYRVGLLALQKAEDYKGAVDCGEHLLYQSDNPKIIIEDYYNLANCYTKTHKDQKAIEMFRNVINFQLDDPDDQKAVSNKRDMTNMAYQTISKIYVDAGEWDKAIGTYEEYCAWHRQQGKLSAYDLSQLARIYLLQSEEMNGDEKTQCYLAANRVYEQMAQEFPQNEDFALEQMIYNCNRMDPGSERGLAKPYADRLLAVVSAKPDKEKTDLNRLKLANRVIGVYYYLTKKDKKASLPYWRKVYELDPTDAGARAVLGIK